jgi:hypothetical protein
MPPQYRAWRAAPPDRDQLGDHDAVDLDHRDPLQEATQHELVAVDVDLAQLEAVALACRATIARSASLAEVAAGRE